MSIFDKIKKKTEEIAKSESLKKVLDGVEDTTEKVIAKSKEIAEDIKENPNVQSLVEKAKKAGRNIADNTQDAAEIAAFKTKEWTDKAMENKTIQKSVETTKNVAGEAGKTAKKLGDKAMENQLVNKAVQSVKGTFAHISDQMKGKNEEE